ncbi:hypothetical protein ANCCAN_18662 [Ancylostoma caninum]|uniref:Helicase ATP-binding domain-containing protein n=1 Tax=Ancylostoma caninum TaxID=29170 RepID=A0A368FVH4_ANCCA|nr:hypothetical protein ANCCAN_18662 [Ancylostoma caninum]
METPARTFFDWRSARARGSARRRKNKTPWKEPKEESWEEERQGESGSVDLVSIFKPKKRKREKVIIDNTHYDKMPICGIEVRLPVGLKPYPSQKLMMVRIITALSKRLNLLAESPTGSGKTMALLASSCAWIQDYKKKRWEATAACPVHNYRAKAKDSTDPPGMFSEAFHSLSFAVVHHTRIIEFVWLFTFSSLFSQQVVYALPICHSSCELNTTQTK